MKNTQRTTRNLAAAAVMLVAYAPGCVQADSFYRNPGYVPSQLAVNQKPPMLEGVGITERLDNQIDLDLEFVAEDGYPHKLREYFLHNRPVILDLVYYNCPQLCTLILNAQAEVMKQIDWTPGNQYEVVTISIDPHESFDQARAKKENYLRQYGHPAPGWHFLVDYKGNAKRVATQVGFNYRYDARIEQFAHPAAVMVLTPEGKMARYLYGIQYKSRDLRFALAEASAGRATMAIEKVLLTCYHYDPNESRYVLFASKFMMAGGVGVLILMGLFARWMIRMERQRSPAAARVARERMA